MKKYIILVFTLVFICGCFPETDDSEKLMNQLAPETIKTGRSFFPILQRENYDSLYLLFDKKFQEEHNIDSVKKFFLQIVKAHGTVSNIEFITTKFVMTEENGKSENFIKNYYKIKYSDHFDSEQILTYTVVDSTTKADKISSYNFSVYSND